jgi:hypothetical protein
MTWYDKEYGERRDYDTNMESDGRGEREEQPQRSSDPTSDHMDLLDAVALLKRWTRKHPDTDLGLKTLDWLKRRNFRGSILR